MKKVYFLMTGLSILLSLAGCSSQAPAETNLQPREIAEAIAKSQTTLPELNQITSSDDDFSLYLSDYDLSDSQVEDGIICYADGVEASEIAVLMMTDEKAADDAQAALNPVRPKPALRQQQKPDLRKRPAADMRGLQRIPTMLPPSCRHGAPEMRPNYQK